VAAEHDPGAAGVAPARSYGRSSSTAWTRGSPTPWFWLPPQIPKFWMVREADRHVRGVPTEGVGVEVACHRGRRRGAPMNVAPFARHDPACTCPGRARARPGRETSRSRPGWAEVHLRVIACRDGDRVPQAGRAGPLSACLSPHSAFGRGPARGKGGKHDVTRSAGRRAPRRDANWLSEFEKISAHGDADHDGPRRPATVAASDFAYRRCADCISRYPGTSTKRRTHI